MNLAFNTPYDGPCIIQNADGLDVTAEELKHIYTTMKAAVEDEISIAPAGIINPHDVHALTLEHIEDVFPAVQHEDTQKLASVVDVPVSTEITPVFKETFCEALSTLGKWNIQERPDSLSQQKQAQELFEQHGFQ